MPQIPLCFYHEIKKYQWTQVKWLFLIFMEVLTEHILTKYQIQTLADREYNLTVMEICKRYKKGYFAITKYFHLKGRKTEVTVKGNFLR